MKRKQHSKEFKAKVALEAPKGRKTVNEIAVEYEVHPSQINTWKKRALEGLAETFGRGQDREAAQLRSRAGPAVPRSASCTGE